MLRQPILKPRELDSPWFCQGAGREPSHPVVVDAERRSNSSVLPHSRLNRFPGFLNSFFYRHLVLTL